MIKLIALDLDDTLLDPELCISTECSKAICAAIKRNVCVTLATGRMYRSALPYALELGLDVPLITYQGALVKTSQSKEVLYHRPVPLDLADKVLGFCNANNLDVNLYMNDMLYVKTGNKQAADYLKLARVPCEFVDDLQAVLTVAPEKLLIMDDPLKLAGYYTPLRELTGGKLHLTGSKLNYLEVTNPQGTKGHALSELAASLGISQSEIMAVGDSYNDLDMVEFAGIGVAMANAVPELKALADYVTLGNDEHGVAEAITRFVLR